MELTLTVRTKESAYGMTQAEIYCRDSLLCTHVSPRADLAIAVALLQVGIDLREQRYSVRDLETKSDETLVAGNLERCQ